MLFLIPLACQPAEKYTIDSAEVLNDSAEEEEIPSVGEADEESGIAVPEPEDQPVSNPESVVRFVAMGDGGEGNTAQYDNGQAVADVCAAKEDDRAGCEFVLYLGDNFYDAGVESVHDNQFDLKFEFPYEPLDIPFYVVLGNHDYGGCLFGNCGTGWDFELSQYQVEYTNYSDKWTMPSEYYTFEKEHVTFFGLDTNAMMWDPWFDSAEDQYPWMEEALASSTSSWKIAFGHHPYISNGRHGNAGTYEGLDWLADWSVADVPLGHGVKDFMDLYICGQVDLYLSGHDHNRQWLEPTC
ncbi:MAG: metallophosphoesterase, partial [Myxococcota bacterium]|nr:metallophosphoesterase [Myxococcota bacterium]